MNTISDDVDEKTPIKERRSKLVEIIKHDNAYDDNFLKDVARPVLGIGFSGGGIRAATISLGAIQSLTRHKRLFDWDYMSSVSGGGYIASFLGSLFVPQNVRGTGNTRPSVEDLAARCKFAVEALREMPDVLAIDAPEANGPGVRKVHSPVHWLRENGRYLAPGGATDYANAATYLTRNWLALTYAFVILVTAIIWAVHSALGGLVYSLSNEAGADVFFRSIRVTLSEGPPVALMTISPFFLLAPLIVVLAIASGVAYWVTDFLHDVNWIWARNRVSDHPRIVLLAGALLLICIAGAYASFVYAFRPDMSYPVTAGGAKWPAPRVPWILALLGSTIAIFGGVIAAASAETRDAGGVPFYIADVRRSLTRIATNFSLMLLGIIAVAIIDTVGIAFHDFLLKESSVGRLATVGWGVVAPAAAWAVHKLLGLGEGSSLFKTIFANYLDEISLLAGVALYAMLAIQADTLAHFIVWRGLAWPDHGMAPKDALNLFAICYVGTAIGILAILTGFSTGFVNLSSLHNFYAARLTRSYLGGANTERLFELDNRNSGTKGNIEDSQDGDDMDISIYQSIRTPAPLHLINVTLNETGGRNDSPLIDRDRKGLSLVFAPEGVILNDHPVHRTKRSWASLPQSDVEPLSLGQLCAISGAAVSTGMGSYTSLGLSLCLTFANARLGYWWQVRKLIEGSTKQPKVFGTFGYLFRELLASFRRDTDRIYLSDGGHFENSGAYELLRRRVKVALVFDNGADPTYAFADLENLVRKARLDMAVTVAAATSGEVQSYFGPHCAEVFLNAKDGNWRAAAVDEGNPAFALLLRVTGGMNAEPEPRWIVWIKPRLIPNDPIDVQGYKLSHGDFPHETTTNQFFDEAQWESYRALGERAIDTLFRRAGGDTVLRDLALGNVRYP